jgi:outer membrane usher protein
MDNRLIWQVRDVEGVVPQRSAELRWDGSTVDGRVRLLDDTATSAAQIEAAQSFVLFDRHLFVADRVDEAFAVVQVGRNAGVEVFRENQPVGRTDAGGRLFVNHLRAYESNGLSVDPAGLPLDAALETTTKTVAPRRGGGAPVTFGVVQERSALVTLMTKSGAAPPAGAEVHLGDRVFPMGYGGEVYLRGLEVGRNVIRVIWRERTCDVVVTVPDELGGIPKLGPYTCTS